MRVFTKPAATFSLIDSRDVNRELFANERSYKAALYALSVSKQLQAHFDKGAWIWVDDDLYKSATIRSMQDDKTFELTIGSSEGGRVCFLGDMHAENAAGELKVWCTKKEVNEFLNRVTVIQPKHRLSAHALIGHAK